MTMSQTLADEVLNAEYTGAATPFLHLHIGAPGINGTTNIAQTSVPANIVRKALSFAAVASHATLERRQVVSNALASWSGAEIDAAQEITHYSIHDAVSAGKCVEIGAVVTPKTTGSDGVTIASGDITIGIDVFLAT